MIMAQVNIRRAKLADLESVLDLWAEMMAFHAQLDARFRPTPDGHEHFASILQDWMSDDRCHVLVAEADGQLVGYIIGRLSENAPVLQPPLYGHVSDICMAPAWRRKGIARRLFASLRNWLEQQGATTVQLHVAAQNPIAQAFWRRMGFWPFMTRMWLDLEPEGKEQSGDPGSRGA
jgi:ribosomal protein S18 acetylase RimI-like enzyme